MDNGLTETQGAEMVTHLAFYADWPGAFSTLSVVKDVLEKRPHQHVLGVFCFPGQTGKNRSLRREWEIPQFNRREISQGCEA